MDKNSEKRLDRVNNCTHRPFNWDEFDSLYNSFMPTAQLSTNTIEPEQKPLARKAPTILPRHRVSVHQWKLVYQTRGEPSVCCSTLKRKQPGEQQDTHTLQCSSEERININKRAAIRPHVQQRYDEMYAQLQRENVQLQKACRQLVAQSRVLEAFVVALEAIQTSA
jgi:hypothetical protein